MNLIKPSLISGEILTLFEEADEKVIIISPFYKIHKWYKLLSRIESLKERDIDIEIFVKKGETESINEIKHIGIEPIEIKNLHCKIYLNEKQAIVASMNLILNSDINSLDIAYKTTCDKEYNEVVDFYKRYIKQKQTEAIVRKRDIISIIDENIENIKIYTDNQSLRIKTRSNNYECFVWNVGNKRNKLRIGGILSGNEFDKYRNQNMKIQQKTGLEIEFLESGHKNGYGYCSVWGISINALKTQNISNIQSSEIEIIANNIISFINEVEKIKNFR